MKQQDLIDIANAKTRLESIRELNDQFVQHAMKNAVPQDVPSKLEFDGQMIAVNCFGHKASATPRPVRLANGNFAVEYRFLANLGEETCEIWRFYLTSNGKLAESLEPEETICDFNNTYIAKQICGRVLVGALRSPLFSISPRQANYVIDSATVRPQLP